MGYVFLTGVALVYRDESGRLRARLYLEEGKAPIHVEDVESYDAGFVDFVLLPPPWVEEAIKDRAVVLISGYPVLVEEEAGIRVQEVVYLPKIPSPGGGR
ncbi:MAG: hypothetical protein QW734_07840 [Candidatus Bathyarchaeia archaeon]